MSERTCLYACFIFENNKQILIMFGITGLHKSFKIYMNPHMYTCIHST